MNAKNRKYLGYGLLALGMALVLFNAWDFLSHRRELPMGVGTTGMMLTIAGGALVRRARSSRGGQRT